MDIASILFGKKLKIKQKTKNISWNHNQQFSKCIGFSSKKTKTSLFYTLFFRSPIERKLTQLVCRKLLVSHTTNKYSVWIFFPISRFVWIYLSVLKLGWVGIFVLFIHWVANKCVSLSHLEDDIPLSSIYINNISDQIWKARTVNLIEFVAAAGKKKRIATENWMRFPCNQLKNSNVPSQLRIRTIGAGRCSDAQQR